MTRKILLLGLLGLLAACGKQPDDGPVAVSVIGEGLPALVNPDRRALTPAEAVLIGATAQGLVRFDATGQIEPGLAIRWDVSDDGIYYDFRTAEESAIDAEQTARAFRAAMAPASRNAFKFLFGAVDEVVAVTPEVVEFRLRAPRPNMLQLLAQPELALFDKRREGTGPFHVAHRTKHMLLLAPVPGPETEDLDEAERERREVQLRGEPAALAVARFEAGKAALVLGGTFANLGVARAANLPANALRFDPVMGLFGLEIASTKGFAGTAENRRALSMAIDRDAIVRAFGAPPGWRITETLVPGPLADLPAPASPDFIATNIAIRRALARESVATWVTREGSAPRVRVALPPGPGARLLFTLLRLDWRSVGIEAEAVAPDADADLRLIDEVAPIDGAAWYLRQFTCARQPACSEDADVQLNAARNAAIPAERARLLALADTRFAQITPFIPIATPLRWSLVAQRLGGFQENGRGIHPLNHLRRPPR